MGNKPLLWRMILCSTLLVLLAGVPSCVVQPETRPRAWIDVPKDGAEVGVNTPVVVTFHAYAEEGVAEITLSVNGEQYVRKPPPQPGAQFTAITQEWLPEQPGEYVLQVRAYDTKGEVSNPASIRVEVVPAVTLRIATPSVSVEAFPPAPAEEPTDTPTGTAVQTPTSAAPSAPTSTTIPTATPTSTPTSTATTPPPPRITSFDVSRHQITAGECVRFNWRVEGYPTEIYFDGEGVTSPDSRDRCPGQTTTYTLRARGPGGEDTESLVVEVTQPPEDTEGPTIDTVSHSPKAAYCSQQDQVQITARVTDPSAVASVQLYCALSGGMTQPKEYCGDFSKSGNDWVVTYDPKMLGHCPAMTTPDITVKYWIRAADASAGGNESEWGPGSFTVL